MSGYLGPGKATFFDNNGDPLIGGQVWTLQPGSSGFDTLAPSYGSYEDAIAGTNPHTNPIILDSRGEAVIIINQAVKMVVEDANVVGGHGNLIWSVDNVAVAAIGGADVGVYHFLNNSIVDGNDNTAVGFLTDNGANSYLVITSKNSNDPPELSAFCAGVTNQDLIISPQNGGSVLVGNELQINYQTGSNHSNIKLTSTDASSAPSITVTSTDSNENLDINVPGSGTINLNSAVTIDGNIGVLDALDVTGRLRADNAIIGTGSDANCLTVSTGGNLSTLGFVTATNSLNTNGAVTLAGTSGLKFNDSSFTHTYTTPTLAANKSWILPSVDGTAGSALTTNGSGTLTYGSPTLAFSLGIYGVTITSSLATTTIPRTSILTDAPGNMATANTIYPSVLGWYRIQAYGTFTTTLESVAINLRCPGGQPTTTTPVVLVTNGVAGALVCTEWYVQVTGSSSITNSFYLELIPSNTVTCTISLRVSATLIQRT